jgi:hypothetical protein
MTVPIGFHVGTRRTGAALAAKDHEDAVMTPEREFLLQQATACRQLALIADPDAAAKLKTLASEYEAQARIDQGGVSTASSSAGPK